MTSENLQEKVTSRVPQMEEDLRVSCVTLEKSNRPKWCMKFIQKREESFSEYSTAYSELYEARSWFKERSKTYSFNGPRNIVEGSEIAGNPELKRRSRVASYNMYAVEGKFKSSMHNSFKWIKNKLSDDFYDE